MKKRNPQYSHGEWYGWCRLLSFPCDSQSMTHGDALKINRHLCGSDSRLPTRIQYKLNNTRSCECIVNCSVLSLWLSSTFLHTLPYSPLFFWYSQLPGFSHHTFHCWLPRLFCLQPLYLEWPSPSSPTQTLTGLLQIKPQDISFSKTTDLPFHTAAFLCLKFPFVVHVSCAKIIPRLSHPQDIHKKASHLPWFSPMVSHPKRLRNWSHILVAFVAGLTSLRLSKRVSHPPRFHIWSHIPTHFVTGLTSQTHS